MQDCQGTWVLLFIECQTTCLYLSVKVFSCLGDPGLGGSTRLFDLNTYDTAGSVTPLLLLASLNSITLLVI